MNQIMWLILSGLLQVCAFIAVFSYPHKPRFPYQRVNGDPMDPYLMLSSLLKPESKLHRLFGQPNTSDFPHLKEIAAKRVIAIILCPLGVCVFVAQVVLWAFDFDFVTVWNIVSLSYSGAEFFFVELLTEFILWVHQVKSWKKYKKTKRI